MILRSYSLKRMVFQLANETINWVRQEMSKYKYTGPAGIDFYVFKDQTQTLHMKSFGEINPRTTMAK